jgi:hypothetical protein
VDEKFRKPTIFLKFSFGGFTSCSQPATKEECQDAQAVVPSVHIQYKNRREQSEKAHRVGGGQQHSR